jgi:hypothetical protein
MAFLGEIPGAEGWGLHLLTLSGSKVDFGSWSPLRESGTGTQEGNDR